MNSKVKDLVFMAMYAALFAVLDVFSNEFIPFLQMPKGGSIGVSTVVLLVCSYHLGWKKAVLSGLISVLVQFVTGPMYVSNLLGFFLDYLFAFSIYGIASLFPNFGYIYTGVIITNFLRFVSHTIGGVLVWETPLWGSITYNAPYMIATCIVGMILVDHREASSAEPAVMKPTRGSSSDDPFCFIMKEEKGAVIRCMS